MKSRDLPLFFLLLLGIACSCGQGQGEKPQSPPREKARAAGPARKQPIRARRPVFAGTWYPADPKKLDAALQALLDKVKLPPLEGRVLAVIAPHAGLPYSGGTAAWSFAALARARPERVFLLGPSHRAPIRGTALPEVDAFATPLGNLPVDRKECARLLRLGKGSLFFLDEAVHDGEHSLEMETIFLAKVLPGVTIVPGVVGDLTLEEARRTGKILREELGPKDALVISSDFTHWGANYGYWGNPPFHDHAEENLARLDRQAWEAVRSLDPAKFLAFYRKTRDTICGRYPIAVLLAALPPGTGAVRLHYETSGRITGDWTSSVSYQALAFAGKGWKKEKIMPDYSQGPLNEEEKALARKIAWKAVELWVKEGRRLDPSKAGLEPKGALLKTLACFVTLKKRGQLRGCIGSIYPSRPLWKDLVERAVDAAAHDPRFEPVRPEELPDLSLEISVLTPLKKVSGPEDIVVGRDGVALTKGFHRAVFLPQVAPEQGWDRDTMLSFLARKAGLPPEAWKEGCTFETFQAQVF